MAVKNETAPILDMEAALERVGGDEDLLKEIGALFLQEFPPAISALRTAVASRDPKRIEGKAHSLKGSVSTFGSGMAFQATLDLEIQGRSGDLTAVDSNLERAELSLACLCQELQKLIS
jgi:HPt (histidine-containing phosphotransfer) domain-containing protein